MDTLELLKKRYSPRAFSDKKISEEDIEKIFEAGRWAASAYNEQPWRFYYATKENMESYNKFIDCMIEFNQAWAKNSYMIVLSTAKKTFSHNGKDNNHSWYDVGQSVANMVIEATSLGIHTHQMSGFFPEKAKELFNIPDEYEPVSMIVFGYLGDPGILPDELRKMEGKPRTRKEIKEIFTKF